MTCNRSVCPIFFLAAAFFLLTAGFPYPDPSRPLNSYLIESWKVENGLPQNTVKSIVQTQDTYLWLSTHEGLVRFNGVDFTVFDSHSDAGILSDSFHPLLVDQQGAVWAGTNGAGVYRLQNGKLTHLSEREGLPFSFIRHLAQTPDGSLWIGTLGGGLAIRSSDQIRTIDTRHGLASNLVYHITPMKDGTVWAGTSAGITVIRDGQVIDHPVSRATRGLFVNDMLPRKDGSVWIATSTGILIHHPEKTRWLGVKDGLNNQSVTVLFEDLTGAVWIGGPSGVNRYYLGKMESLTRKNGLSHDNIWCFFQDHEGNLWIGTTNGLNRLSSRRFSGLTESTGLTNDFIRSVFEDSRGDVWIGTDGGGVNRVTKNGIEVLNRKSGLADDRVFSFTEDSEGAIWIGTGGGVSRYHRGRLNTWGRESIPGSGVVMAIAEGPGAAMYFGTAGNGLLKLTGKTFTPIELNRPTVTNFIRTLLLDSAGTFWVGTNGNGLFILNGDQLQPAHLPGFDSTSVVYSLYQDSSGIIWAGTNNGIARLSGGKARMMSEHEGLMDNLVLQIIDDGAGYFWLTTNKGPYRVKISQLNEVADGLIEKVDYRRFDKSDGLRSMQCNGGSSPAGIRRSNGDIWIPTSEGVVIANLADLQTVFPLPVVTIEEVLIDGIPVSIQSPLELVPGWNRMEIRYIGINYHAPEKVTYRYFLDGFDRDWLDAGNRNSTWFTNLPAGEYVFRVTAANPDGILNPVGASLHIVISPRFYETSWFNFLIVSFLVGILYFLYKRRIRRIKANEKRLRQIVKEQTAWLEVEKEQAERARREAEYQREVAEQSSRIIEAQNQKIIEIDKAKSAFFSNISHEFRTPLTLTIGPLEHAMNDGYGPVPAALKEQMEMMLRNSRRLLRLINQLLDVARMDSGKTVLQASEGNLNTFLRELISAFQPYAARKSIHLEFLSDTDPVMLWFDRDKLDKVFYNLLSNAFKFTPDGGSIIIQVKAQNASDRGDIEVLVSDTGVGIPAADLPYIFERFRQSGSVSVVGTAGSGIGLSMVRDYIELHGGSVEVASQPGSGTSFRLFLKSGRDHLGDEQIVKETMNVTDRMAAETLKLELSELEETTGSVREKTETQSTTRSAVLVVDDNRDIRNYIRDILQDHYDIMEASNGREGLSQMAVRKPALVISDVMMPEMNGYDLTRTIKSDPQTSAIPVILLTAKATGDMKVEGLESGANDYMYKPFYAKELLARVRNLILLYEQEQEVKRINDTLTQTNEDLREANNLKTELLNIAAHDLKNPLQAIIGNADLLTSQPGFDEKTLRKIDQIRQAANRMLHQVNEILVSATIESGKLELNKVRTDLSAAIGSVISSNQMLAQKKNQTIVWTPCNNLWLGADEIRLREIVENLIGNAIKYSPGGANIWVSAGKTGQEVWFSVRDEGPGLSASDMSLLFHKFQRLTPKPTGGETSTGLGLSIVKRLVELHGGRVTVESAEGSGSEFSVYFPSWPSVQA
ncbi:MAG: response regulator [Bacteroidetes bacterium]|nr:response regulator [Bacteroidota bacterium]